MAAKKRLIIAKVRYAIAVSNRFNRKEVIATGSSFLCRKNTDIAKPKSKNEEYTDNLTAVEDKTE
jgi:hypothetical protein